MSLLTPRFIYLSILTMQQQIIHTHFFSPFPEKKDCYDNDLELQYERMTHFFFIHCNETKKKCLAFVMKDAVYNNDRALKQFVEYIISGYFLKN